MELYHKESGNLLIDCEDLGLDPNCNKGITYSNIVPCVFPDAIDKKNNANLLFFLLFISNVIQRKNKTFASLNNMFTYYLACYKTPAYPVKTKISMCNRLNVLRIGDKFNSYIIVATVGAEARIRVLKPDDQH
ncbi:hypothetical protein ABEB36_000049 [Hypothenemus hampei]|uniref:Uncharacterized protein n=1 Tax=Hypothenemus hampei TaxID=57062 RepID=A0ABD1FBX9_HYPHA